MLKIKEYLNDIIGQEYARLFLFIPVLIGIGILIYFELSFEPSIPLTSLLLIIIITNIIFTKSDITKIFLFLLLFVLLGIFIIEIKAKLLNTKLIKRKISYDKIIGKVTNIEKLDKFNRYTINNTEIINKTKNIKLNKIRVLFDKNINVPEIGSTVEFSAILIPSYIPIFKNDFDFRKYSYFHEISASGKSIGVWKYHKYQIKNNIFDKLLFKIQNIRNLINTKIENNHSLINKGIITSIMIGERYNIDNSISENYKNAGISHLLSISGFHLSIIIGSIFFIIRFLLSLNIYISNKYNSRKIVSIISFIASSFYLLISGARISTIRAFIMSCIILLSIILDKVAISLRSVSIAALILLIIYPESVINVGFQLSFMAVIALIKLYEYKDKWSISRDNFYIKNKTIIKILNFIIGIIVSSFMTFIYTLPIIIYHFHSIQIYSILGNLLALPFFILIVMPSILFSFIFIFMSFNLEHIFLNIADFGIAKINYFASIISNLPYSSITVTRLDSNIFFVIILGIIIFSFFKTKIKYLGVSFIIFGIIEYILTKLPNLVVNKNNDIFAINGKDKVYIINLGKFNNINWFKSKLENYLNKPSEIISNKDNFIVNNTKISFMYNLNQYKCNDYDLIFLSKKNYKNNNCYAKIFDKSFMANSNNAEFFIDNKSFTYNKYNYYKNRPWNK